MAARIVCCVRTAPMFKSHLNNQHISILLLKKQWISHSVPTLPVITVPIPMKATIKKVIAKQKRKQIEEMKAISRIGDKSAPVITSKRQINIHYKGQVYDKFKPLPLCTKGWFTRKSNGDYFEIKGFENNPAILNPPEWDVDTPRDFKSFGLSQEILNGLEQMNIKAPTSIQASAIPAILKPQNVICAAESGSGKTLSYLIPMIHNILEYRSRSPGEILTNSPLGLIIVPGRELAQQIGTVIRTVTKDIPFRSKVIVGGSGVPENLLTNPPLNFVDIIVTTLGAFKKLVFAEIYNAKKIRHLVIDEADTMLDDSFNESLIKFMHRFKFLETLRHDKGTQLCLVGATMPRDVTTILDPVIEAQTMEKITTNHLHRIMPHVPQKFLKLKPSDKPIRLLELVKTDLKYKKPVVIFSKDNKTCDYVTMFLKENGVDNINFNASMPDKLRRGQFERFQDGELDVLSCTDVGSRGLDTTRVQHVINYDFPNFVSDYIHRSGRTGRVGSKKNCRVTNFISKKYEVELVQKIETSVRTAESLPNVNANITRKLDSLAIEGKM